MRLKKDKGILYRGAIFAFLLSVFVSFLPPSVYITYAADSDNEILIGNFVTDAYRYAANQSISQGEKQFDAAFIVSSVLKTPLPSGIEDIGMGEIFIPETGFDNTPGIPLVSVYLTGGELKRLAEIDASILDGDDFGRIYFSGLSFEYNRKRPVLDKVSDVYLSPAMLEESRTEINDKELYRVAGDLYSLRTLEAMSQKLFGLLKIVPKDESGSEINDLTDSLVIYDADGSELKASGALLSYFSSFSHSPDGVREIPSYYKQFHERKAVLSTFSPSQFFKNTSSYFYIFVFSLVAFILIIAIIIRAAIHRRHKKKVFIE